MSRLLIATLSLSIGWGCYAQKPHAPFTDCQKIAPELFGPEDFAIDHVTIPGATRLIISARAVRSSDPSVKNGIWSLPIASLAASPLLVKGHGTDDCPVAAPHGIAVASQVPSEPGLRLFVINEKSCLGQDNPCTCQKGEGGFSVERYRVGPDDLIFEERYASGLLLQPNDLDVSQDGSELYVSNAQAGSTAWLRGLQQALQTPSGNVLRGVRRAPGWMQWTIADDGLSYANGVALDEARNRLYVAELYRGWIRVYDIKRSCVSCGDTLVRVGVIRIGSGPDNLLWQNSDKTLMDVAAHPSILRFLGHYLWHARSPSEAYVINLAEAPSAHVVYADDIKEFSGASTALELADRLYLGEALDNGLLSCAFPGRDVESRSARGAAEKPR